jgi:S-(hydroxymethyl)glutathione dehydrogenase/alcohol dehydrogenase
MRVDGQRAFPALGTGTLAEEAVVPSSAAIKIAKDIPFHMAALVGCGVMTGVGAALNTAQVRPGSSVVVFGCGGVGINVIQGARVAGAAEIVAVDPLTNKHEWAMRFGATHAVTPDDLPAIARDLTGNLGFDYAFEAAGSPELILAAWGAIRRGGTAVLIGSQRPGDTVTFDAFDLYIWEKKLFGCLYGSADVRRDFATVLKLWRAGKLDLEGLVTRRARLDDVSAAFDAMERGDVIRTVIEF